MPDIDSAMTLGCYLHAASALQWNAISKRDFFRHCLTHLGSTDVRVRHPEDSDTLDSLLGLLFWKGAFGPVASAIRLCEPESEDPAAFPGIRGVDLVPIFLACDAPGSDLALIRSLDGRGLLASSLFRQALLVTAIAAGHESLACDIVRCEPSTPPPPPDQCVFTMRLSSLVDDENISPLLWATLVAAGWTPPSSRLAQVAASSGSGTDGLVLLEALKEAGYDPHSDPIDKQLLPYLALAGSQPATLQSLWDTYSIVPTNETLVSAIELQNPAGVELLRWLLERHGLDVNYMRAPEPGAGITITGYTDSRDRAEQEYALRQTASSRQMSALHAAAFEGNTEIVKFLLERGANADASDGYGRTAMSISREKGHDGVLRALKDWKLYSHF